MKRLNNIVLTIGLLALSSCGTIYIPQILPEARGVGKSIGQENISVKIVPVTSETLIDANRLPYVRRVIDASDLNQPAKLVSVEDAISENLPPRVSSQPYRLGVGDEGERIASKIGNNSILMMGQHGILVIGSSVAETFNKMYYF